MNHATSVPQDYFQWFDNLIIELKDAFLVSPTGGESLKPVAYEVINSDAWFEFQKGHIDRSQCQQRIAQKLCIAEAMVCEAIKSSTPDTAQPEMSALMRDLRKRHRLFAVGNLSPAELEQLEYKMKLSSVFDQIFTSAQTDERLPFPGFFNDMITPTGTIDPRRSLYISADLDSTVTARSLGSHVLQFQDAVSTPSLARSMTGNPLPRAWAYLRKHAGNLDLITDLGHVLKDTFAQFIILDATNDPSILHPSLFPPNSPSLFSWLYAPPPKGFTPFPPDIDTNSFAYTTLTSLSVVSAHALMDQVLCFRSRDGIPETYLTHHRTRLDATACVNVLALFHKYGRGHQLLEAEDWVFAVMHTRAYATDTRYYPTGDFFLYFLSRLLQLAPALRPRFAATFRECVQETKGLPGDALALALRVVCMTRVGVTCEGELERLLSLQEEDGSWGDGCCYQYARIRCRCYHRGLTTAMAILAVREWNRAREQKRMDC